MAGMGFCQVSVWVGPLVPWGLPLQIPICVAAHCVGECRLGTVIESDGLILVRCCTEYMWLFGIVQYEKGVC